MKDGEFIQLSNLFNSLGIIEKGIGRIYHYLLENKRIENLKRVCSQYNLSLKRGYKVCSVLNDLSLVQIYDRPMKISLATPILPIWQRLINERIEGLQNEFQEKKKKCESSLETFLTSYNIKEEVSQELIEFINFKLENFEDMYYPFLAKTECKIALGIRYENPLTKFILMSSKMDIEKDLNTLLLKGMTKIEENLKNIDIQVIFNNELVKELINSKEFVILTEQVESFEFDFKSIKVRITEDLFSNFSLNDNELSQPSFDPANILLGAYISRNKNIYQIFYDKFNEIFEKGVPINEYLKSILPELAYQSLSDKQTFALCLL